MKKILGVLGGMGPGATADAFLKLVSNSQAKKDQEHIPVIIASLPTIPDRTENILYGGPSPLPAMINSLKILDKSGASCIIMPCNTAHYWYNELKKNTDSEFISIIESTCKKIIADDISSVALVATTATIKTQLYQNYLAGFGIKCMAPDSDDQDTIMESIIAYKSGKHDLSFDMMAPCIARLKEKGAKKIIMGCTEVPLILKNNIINHPECFIDTTEELIRQAVNWFYQKE